jgi:hypothetical protein
MRRVAAAVAVLLLTGCTGAPEQPVGDAPGRASYDYPEAPAVPDAPLEASVASAMRALVRSAATGALDARVLETVAESGDARIAWLISDLLRFYQGTEADGGLVDAFNRLTGTDVRLDPLFEDNSWRSVTDHLIGWDLPAPPGYRETKAELFLALDSRWAPFFEDADAEIDWRLVSWGGVFLDNRPLGDPNPCPLGCIPALDDPKLIPASEGDWYPNERLVFGVVVGGRAVALPKNVMEVHEMVNITIGGRRLGIPYCTLCGSAQAYFVDCLPARARPIVLRTSGLLSRSNKVMFDLTSRSVFDTFTGRALSGPLQDADVVLPQATVVSSEWGAWKRAHPETRIVAQDGGIGRSYPNDPLGGRDDDGPIFPVGDVDPRLPVQAQIVGVIAPDGTPVAFVAADARSAIARGETVEAGGIELVADGSGMRAQTEEGRGLPAHQAYWFAWSQFHPETELWQPD